VRKTTFLGFMAMILLGCVLAATRSDAEQEGDNQTPQSPFKGQILVISSKSNVEIGAVLEDASVKRLGQHSFLVGKGADDCHPDNWHKGRTVWVAIDDIAQIAEFENIDEYTRHQKELAAQEEKREAIQKELAAQEERSDRLMARFNSLMSDEKRRDAETVAEILQHRDAPSSVTPPNDVGFQRWLLDRTEWDRFIEDYLDKHSP